MSYEVYKYCGNAKSSHNDIISCTLSLFHQNNLDLLRNYDVKKTGTNCRKGRTILQLIYLTMNTYFVSEKRMVLL